MGNLKCLISSNIVALRTIHFLVCLRAATIRGWLLLLSALALICSLYNQSIKIYFCDTHALDAQPQDGLWVTWEVERHMRGGGINERIKNEKLMCVSTVVVNLSMMDIHTYLQYIQGFDIHKSVYMYAYTLLYILWRCMSCCFIQKRHTLSDTTHRFL